jgi:hypothetical protein
MAVGTAAELARVQFEPKNEASVSEEEVEENEIDVSDVESAVAAVTDADPDQAYLVGGCMMLFAADSIDAVARARYQESHGTVPGHWVSRLPNLE